MDKDRVAGSAKQMKGSIKEAIGKVAGDTKLQFEGEADQGRRQDSECRRRSQRHAQRRSEEIAPEPTASLVATDSANAQLKRPCIGPTKV